MIYENYEDVTTLVKEINKQEEKLAIVNSEPWIVIKKKYRGGEIEIDTESEEDYFFDIAESFLNTMIANIKGDIDKLKKDLGKL